MASGPIDRCRKGVVAMIPKHQRKAYMTFEHGVQPCGVDVRRGRLEATIRSKYVDYIVAHAAVERRRW